MGGVNLVNLLLVRASVRARELAIRRSLGASRGDLARHALVETVLLALLGGPGRPRRRRRRHPPARRARRRSASARRRDVARPPGSRSSRSPPRSLSARSIALPIAWFDLRGGAARALTSESRSSTTSAAAQRLRHAFLVAQIALAFGLLAGAGLLGLSLDRALAISPGFRPDHVIAGRVTLSERCPRAGTRSGRLRQPPARRAVARAGRRRRRRDHGRAGQRAGENNAMTVVGYTPPPGVSPILHNRYGVTGDYFPAMGIPLVAGRFLRAADSGEGPRVCVVDEDFARHYWPGGSAIGQRVFEGPPQGRRPDEAFTIVGVVGAVKQQQLTDAGRGAIYFPYRYNASTNVFLVARTALDAGGVRSGAAARSSAASIRNCRWTICGRWTSASPTAWSRGGRRRSSLRCSRSSRCCSRPSAPTAC